MLVLLEPDRWRRRGIATVLDESKKFEVVDEVCADADVVVLSHRLIVERGIDEVARARERYGCDVLVCAEESDLMLAARIAQPVTDYCLFCRSHGHQGLDQALNLFRATALLELGMESTDGTGATLAWPLVRSATALLTDVADGEEAGPTRPGGLGEGTPAVPILPPSMTPEGGLLY